MSRSTPPGIPIQQSGDLGEIEHPEELGLPQSLVDERSIQIEQRPRDGRARDPLDERDLVGFVLDPVDLDAVVLPGSGARDHLGPSVVRGQAVQRGGRAVARNRVGACCVNSRD
jgi:hypothetical protein